MEATFPRIEQNKTRINASGLHVFIYPLCVIPKTLLPGRSDLAKPSSPMRDASYCLHRLTT